MVAGRCHSAVVAQLPSNHALGTEVFLAFDCTKDLGQTLTVSVALEKGWKPPMTFQEVVKSDKCIGGTELYLTKIDDHLRRKVGFRDNIFSLHNFSLSQTSYANSLRPRTESAPLLIQSGPNVKTIALCVETCVGENKQP